MAKILVADDNSNVQKTVTLALANLGIEVVSVNNGDAAVRKLADFSPDLILADIFMPVRNGYEVCEYVKKDGRFANVPVVLLVGAFDPLDEREAQRVGADGILKKPFVPPDPLITMVKTLLHRTLGERLAEMSVAKPVVAARANSSAVAVADEGPAPAASPQGPPTEYPPSPGRVEFAESEHPVAFSQLLDVSAQETVSDSTAVNGPVDDEQVLTSSRDAKLGDPIFWRNDEPESERAPVEEIVDDGSASLGTRPWQLEDDTSLLSGDDAVLLQPVEPIELAEPSEPPELIREEQDETSQTIVDSESIVLDPAGQSALTVEPGKPEELAANPLEWMATAPPIQSSEVPWETSQGDFSEPSPELSLQPSEVPSETTPGHDALIAESAQLHEATDADSVTPKSTAELDVATPGSVPDPVQVSEPEVVKFLVPVTLSAPSSPVSSVSAGPETTVPNTTPEPSKTQPSITELAQSPEDTVRSVPKQDWEDLTASLLSRASELVPEAVKPATESVTPAAATPSEAIGDSQHVAASAGAVSSLDAAMVEAVVQRVIDKLGPQVVEIITKEFLRPVVQTLVDRKVENK